MMNSLYRSRSRACFSLMASALMLGGILWCAGCATSISSLAPTATPQADTPTVAPPATKRVNTPTLIVPISQTARPTKSPTATPTLAAPLATRGPYLIYTKGVNSRESIYRDELVIMDTDGKGRKTLPLPSGVWVNSLTQSVSPDGKWLAFYTGLAESPFGTDQQGPYDLALNLMDLSNGQTRLLTPLLSADYPDNFRKAALALIQQGEPVDQSDFLRGAFARGIRSLDWSPDGRYLAFAGQMEGLSSDLYVYDVKTQAIRRLSDGPGQIQSITWSPDGRWILHSSSTISGKVAELDYHAASVDGSIKTCSSTNIDSRNFWGWLAPSTYLQSHTTNGLPGETYHLQSVNIESGAIKTLWAGSFRSIAFDPENNLLALTGFESLVPAQHPTLFLIDLSNGNQRKIKEADAIEFVGVRDKRFIAAVTVAHFSVMADGSTGQAGYCASAPVSPDRQYCVFLVSLGKELQVYAADTTLVREIKLGRSVGSTERIIWRPDSSGLFFTWGSELYAANLLEGEAYLVDRDVLTGRAFDYMWGSCP